MKIKYLCAMLLVALAYSCDDSTTGIGDSTIPGGDHIPAGYATYDVTTRSILTDSVYARTSTAYLGRYTDPQFGEFTADFLAQFTCTDNFQYPDSIKKITGLNMKIQYLEFFGDSINAMRMRIDTLDRIIPENDKSTSYTNVDPSLYYNELGKALVEKAYSAVGPSVHDTAYKSGNNTMRVLTQTVKMPTNLGQFMYKKYEENKNNYKDADAFIKNVLKGIFVQCTHGDGTILYIDNLKLYLSFDYLIARKSTGKIDSLVNGTAIFAATKEVVQANRFQNSEKLKELVNDPNCTYVKTPAGILTEATIPMQKINDEHLRDTLNAASISFTRYNDKGNGKYPMGTPKNLLMVRKKEMYSFFEQNKMYDNKTSFFAAQGQTNATANTYTFTNIAQLITTCLREKEAGIKKEGDQWLVRNPDWNKVVLIPVKTDEQNQVIVGVTNNLNMESAMLKGGTKEGNALKMQILYTTFSK